MSHFVFFSEWMISYIEDPFGQCFQLELAAVLPHVEHRTINDFVVDNLHSSKVVFEGVPDEDSLFGKESGQEEII